MKTAISVPDDTFARVDREAHALGISRSEFFTRAAQRFLDDLDTDSLTRRIDAALDILGGTDESNFAVAAASRRKLADESW